MHDDAIVALNLEQLATMTDRLLLRAGRVPSALVAASAQGASTVHIAATRAHVAAPVEVTADRFSVPSLARRARQARVSPPIAPSRAPRAVAACALEGSTVHGYAPAPRGPEPTPPAVFANGSLSPVQLAHEVFAPEPVTCAPAYETAPRPVAARGSSPQLAPPEPFEPERTLCVRPLPSPVPISLATRAVRALRSPSFAVKILVPALVGAILGLVAML